MYNLGFHLGPGGNPTGIGEYMRRLDAAGRPFCIKSVDHYGPVFEACQYGGADHIRVFRISSKGQNDGYDYDTAPYHLPPNRAAAIHWQATIAKLPPEFDKAKVWLEVINEPDKNRAAWLGDFATEIMLLAWQDKYKLAMFGFSAGEPEPAAWETPTMLDFLRLCAGDPEHAAIALHEYSLNPADLMAGAPWMLGRYFELFQAADRHGIARPTTIITEFGWTEAEIPGDLGQAMDQLQRARPIYTADHQIKGQAIWYLGAGHGNIANQVQRLIQPVTDARLSWPMPEPQPGPGPEPQPGPGPEPQPEPQPDLGPVLGVDVSHWQPPINWAKCRHNPDRKEGDVGFAFIRASNGIVRDNLFENHWQGAGGVGLFRGAYHYYREDKKVDAQLQLFQAIVGDRGELPPVLDVEIYRYYPQPTANRVLIALQEIERLFGRTPILYTNLQWLNTIPKNHPLRGFGYLWLAAWTSAQNPIIPSGWDTWTFWQYGSAPGANFGALSARIDVDRFNGNMEQLQHFSRVEGVIDLAKYFLPANDEDPFYGPVFVLSNNWGGGDERVQVQWKGKNGDLSVMVKNSQWERRRISDFIYLEADTSPGGGRFYTVSGAWLPLRMQVGQVFSRVETVTWYDKVTCQQVGRPYTMTSEIKLEAHYDTFTSKAGVIVSDVIQLAWLVNGRVDERYYYAAGMGLIKWAKYDGRDSWISAILPNEPNLIPEEIKCLN